MLYREYGKTKENVSILGFGCMRFPTKDGKINETLSTEMINYALEQGINYFDTAYPYHNGDSESFVGRVLKPYRKKVYIATKLPSWLINSYEDMENFLSEQLERLQTDYIDFYLVHALNKEWFDSCTSKGLFKFLTAKKAEGVIKHVGFSFHDTLDVFKEIVDSYNWDFCQIQFNYLDINYQAGLEGLNYASSRGLGIAIMEPLRGGKLVSNIPKDIENIWDKAEIKRSPVQWALKYLWSNPKIHVVLSGMSDFSHVRDNINIASNSHADELSYADAEIVAEVQAAYLSKIKVNCTACKYCMPCPVGVDIPTNFDYLNNASLFNDKETYKKPYLNLKDSASSKNCIKCGKCESLCPQNINIREKLEETTKFFLTD